MLPGYNAGIGSHKVKPRCKRSAEESLEGGGGCRRATFITSYGRGYLRLSVTAAVYCAGVNIVHSLFIHKFIFIRNRCFVLFKTKFNEVY